MNDIKKLLKLSLIADPKDYETMIEMMNRGIDISKIVKNKKKKVKKRHIKTK